MRCDNWDERCDFYEKMKWYESERDAKIEKREENRNERSQKKSISRKTSKGKFLKIRERGEVRWEMRWLTGHKIRWWDDIFIPNKVSTIL